MINAITPRAGCNKFNAKNWWVLFRFCGHENLSNPSIHRLWRHLGRRSS